VRGKGCVMDRGCQGAPVNRALCSSPAGGSGASGRHSVIDFERVRLALTARSAPRTNKLYYCASIDIIAILHKHYHYFNKRAVSINIK